MRFQNLTLAREERISHTFALPGGRLVTAELHYWPGIPVASVPAEPDTVQLIVEVRPRPSAPFEEVAASAVLSATGQVTVQVPTPEEPVPAGEHPPVGRLRLIHTGTMHPRYEINLVGL